jgi:HMG (high mobility group) box
MDSSPYSQTNFKMLNMLNEGNMKHRQPENMPIKSSSLLVQELHKNMVRDFEKGCPNKPTRAVAHFEKSSQKKKLEKPKRPLSAYNIFFQVERDRIVKGYDMSIPYSKDELSNIRIIPTSLMPKRSQRKTHGKVSFAELARRIASKWQKLSDNERILFQARAREEKARYENEISKFNQWKHLDSIESNDIPTEHFTSAVILELPKDDLEDYFRHKDPMLVGSYFCSNNHDDFDIDDVFYNTCI